MHSTDLSVRNLVRRCAGLLLGAGATTLLLSAGAARAATTDTAASDTAAVQLADTTGAPPCPPEVMAALHDADFLTVRDLKAGLPHGELVINQGVVASFKGADKHTAGIVVGDMELSLTDLPAGPGTFTVIPPAMQAADGMRVKARMSYLMAAVQSQARLEHHDEFVAAMRRWDALSPAEQAQFEAVYRAAWADGWKDEAATAAAGHPVLREPVDGEIYSALWLADVPGMPAGQLTRIDLQVEADGKTTSAREHRSGMLLLQTTDAG